MTENRDPIECPSCQTVNAWMNEECRSCGQSLKSLPLSEGEESEGEESEDAESADSVQGATAGAGALPASARRGDSQSVALEGQGPGADDDTETRPSVVPPAPDRRMIAIIVGILLHLFIFKMGDVLITRFMIAPNPELVAVYEDFNEGKIEDKKIKQQRVEQIAEYIPPLLWATVALLVLSPLLIGGIVGAVFNHVTAAAWGLGLGTLSILMMFDAGGLPFKSFLILLISIGISVFLMSRIITSNQTAGAAQTTLRTVRSWVLLGGVGAILAIIVYDTAWGAGGASLKLFLGTLIFVFMQAALGGVGAIGGMKIKGKLR